MRKAAREQKKMLKAIILMSLSIPIFVWAITIKRNK